MARSPRPNQKLCKKTWIDDLNIATHRQHRCWLVHSNEELKHDGYVHECGCGRRISNRHLKGHPSA